jgi:hypothetical protein
MVNLLDAKLFAELKLEKKNNRKLEERYGKSRSWLQSI